VKSDFSDIKLERTGCRDSVALITFHRPSRANAMTVAMARELSTALDIALADDGVEAVVLTGTGKSFSPGADAQEALDLADRIDRGEHPAEPFGGLLAAVQKVTLKIYNADKPTVAAINGSAAAGGLDIALACDFRVAAQSSKFAQSYVNLALPPLNGGAWLLTRAVGEARALQILLSGEVIDAERALAIGLAHELEPDDAVLQRAITLAEQLGRGAAEIVKFIKAEVRCARTGALKDALARAYVAGVVATQSPDHRAAVGKMLNAHGRKGADRG